jgi:hypothetical protein
VILHRLGVFSTTAEEDDAEERKNRGDALRFVPPPAAAAAAVVSLSAILILDQGREGLVCGEKKRGAVVCTDVCTYVCMYRLGCLLYVCKSVETVTRYQRCMVV